MLLKKLEDSLALGQYLIFPHCTDNSEKTKGSLDLNVHLWHCTTTATLSLRWQFSMQAYVCHSVFSKVLCTKECLNHI